MNDDNAFPDYLRPCWTRIVYRQASPHARKEKQGYLYVVERGSERFWWYADVKAASVPAESDSLHEWESEAKRAATWHVKRLYGKQQSQLVFGPWRPFELRGHELAPLLLGHKGRSLTARDRLVAVVDDLECVERLLGQQEALKDAHRAAVQAVRAAEKALAVLDRSVLAGDSRPLT